MFGEALGLAAKLRHGNTLPPIPQTGRTEGKEFRRELTICGEERSSAIRPEAQLGVHRNRIAVIKERFHKRHSEIKSRAGTVHDVINHESLDPAAPPMTNGHRALRAVRLYTFDITRQIVQLPSLTKPCETKLDLLWYPVPMNIPERANMSQEALLITRGKATPEALSRLAHRVDDHAPLALNIA